MKVFQSCAVLLALLGLVRADDDWWNPANKFNKWAKMKVLIKDITHYQVFTFVELSSTSHSIFMTPNSKVLVFA